jgi:GNAT superfamily N-acetyltransferase
VAHRTSSHRDAAEVLEVAGEFLESRPTVHNLVLTILHDRAATLAEGRYWLVHEVGGDVVGVVVQSPVTFPALVTPMPVQAAQAAATAISAEGVALPGVNGEASTASAFAGHWAEVGAVGARPVMGMRLQELGSLHMPDGVPGNCRRATADDLPIARRWLDSFAAHTGEGPMGDEDILRRIGDGELDLWQVGHEPMCVVGHRPALADVVRVGPVYTPPPLRRQGYAGAAVAAVSAQAVAAGHRCVLYTDLANPTSNSVYRALGYATISETIRYAFDDPMTNASP